MKQYGQYLLIIVITLMLNACQTTSHLKPESEYERSLMSALRLVDNDYDKDVMLRELYEGSVNRMYSLLNTHGIPFDTSDKQRHLEKSPITQDNYLPWIRDIANQHSNTASNKIDKDKLIESAIIGIADSLDSTTQYRTVSEMREWNRFNLLKKAIDAGIRVRKLKQSMYILKVYKNSPAEKAGIKKGGYVHAINGNSIESINPATVKRYLTGEVGKSIELLVTPSGSAKKRRYTLTFEPYEQPTFSWYTNGQGFGIISLHSLSRNTSGFIKEIEKRMNERSKTGIHKLVLDLRDNSGGLVSEVVDIADLFLTQGRILTANDGNGVSFDANNAEIFKNAEIAILINSHTVAGAELLTRALQYHNRAVVIGYTTQGDGTLSSFYDLENGGRLILTTGQLHFPDGEVVNGNGVQPDICVNFDSKKKKCSKNSSENPEAEQKLIRDAMRKHFG